VHTLERQLQDEVTGEVRFDDGSRATYSTDASNYRQVPLGVVTPRSVEDAVRAIGVCAEQDVPVLSRGGGTSLAGQCCNSGVVLDWSKFCNGLVSVDPEASRCVVEPGIALDDLNRQLAPYGLQYGPRPSTHKSCTIGGMIGHNSCGAPAQAFGKVVDNVHALEVLTYDGLRLWVGPTSEEELARRGSLPGSEGELYRALAELRRDCAQQVRDRYPRIPRRVSGYNLDSLLPENDCDLAGLLVGSESTLVTVLRAELKLVPVPQHIAMAVLGFDDVGAAGDHVPAVVEHGPHTLEGIDHQLFSFETSEGMAPAGRKLLPGGDAWLMVEFTGDTQEEADERARRLTESVTDAVDHALIETDAQRSTLWTVREGGLAATAHPPGMPKTWPGWEDSAVDPARIGDYLRDLVKLFEDCGYDHPSVYGHFGQGCVHCRVPFGVASKDGLAQMRDFMERAADLVVRYDGSLSGEHGDGQARGELLGKMFGPELLDAFRRLKRIFDPKGRMNPGKVVDPAPMDSDLRLGADFAPWEPETAFSFPRDDNKFSGAAMRCVGIGNCRTSEGGVMCPSYRATREEEHSTRGRSRLLFEMIRGDSPVDDGWRSTEVKDALDLCLACKGCRSDCPVGVDMATYKAEFLHHHYAGRLRPMAHYSMGWLPAVAMGASRVPGLVNAVSHAPVLGQALKRLGGIAPQREVPLFAEQRFTDWWRERGGTRGGGNRGEVVVWPDTFTNNFHPAIGRAAVEVLEAAGFHVKVPEQAVCCGLTWISTGQLSVAQKVLRRTVQVLREDLRRGTPVIGLEPSCTAVFRADAPELMPEDEDIARLKDNTRTLAELLLERAPDWEPPQVDADAVVQRHCHQYAIMGYDPDRELMKRAGMRAEVLDAGCCGLAGNFGFERGHYDVSEACAEDALLPALRKADPQSMVLADGFSCRTQVEQSDVGRTPMHLAEVLAAGLRRQRPEPERQEPPSRGRSLAAAAAAGMGALTATAVAGRALRRRD
jgi:FAD/FMN-containing dehydrogenase/Fe-S oxidoreductase